VFPIGDSPKTSIRPWINYLLIVVNIGVFVYMVTLETQLGISGPAAQTLARQSLEGVCYGLLTPPTELDLFFCEFGFQPREFFDVVARSSGIPEPDRPTILSTIITSQFIHGGILHIFGNMLFLFVFGDNVEDRLGHLRYLLFYLVAGIVAAIVQGIADPDSVIPVVGASGAVAGVLGAYIYFYPRATVYVVIPFLFLIFIPLPIPAFIMIGAWFLQNLWAGYLELGSATDASAGVAWFAHIGGFLFGLLMAFVAGKPKRKYKR
jgi:membrane associated rhomboid family serine protease